MAIAIRLHTVWHDFRGRGRRLALDALIAVASVTLVLALVVAIDGRAGDHLARAVRSSAPAHGQVAVQFREDTMTLVRSAWDLSRMHAPLMTFAAVGAVLVIFMIRIR